MLIRILKAIATAGFITRKNENKDIEAIKIVYLEKNRKFFLFFFRVFRSKIDSDKRIWDKKILLEVRF